MEHLIKFYPVENADCTLIKLNSKHPTPILAV